MPHPRIVVVGAAGYIGRRLFHRWPLFEDSHDIHLLDAGLYGDPPPDIEKVDRDPAKVAARVAELKPDIIVNLAALAHDPRGRLPVDAIWDSNVDLASELVVVAPRLIQISSMSVFDLNCDAPYVGSKRSLESRLTGYHPLFQKVRLLRFGTIFGFDLDTVDDTPLPSNRCHLLLNRMVIDAEVHGVIKINGANRRRPVTSLATARQAIFDAITQEGPNASITNHFDGCDTLFNYARVVQSLYEDEPSEPAIETVTEPDTRDYGWPTKFKDAESLWEELREMKAAVVAQPAAFRNRLLAGLDPLYATFGVNR